eukprot:COSAG06_NODE_359_length_16838_cov_15.682359_10_plen_77_part_00
MAQLGTVMLRSPHYTNVYSYTQCTVRLCQLHSQTLKPSFLRPPHTQQQQKNKRPVYLRWRCCNSSVVPELRYTVHQ